MALLAMLIAFWPVLDTTALAAGLAIEAGSKSPILKFIAAFDVLDDALDHPSGCEPNKKAQTVIQLAMPEPDLSGLTLTLVEPVEHQAKAFESISSCSPPPLDRPPRA